jgi:endonuclease YncB( thermonuclease family)
METKALAVAAALILGTLAGSAAVQTVVDGDTIKLNGTAWRLWGIDAPEMKQMCSGQALGLMAAGTMDNLIKGKTITCEDKGRDRYGRSIGLCRADGEDLGAAMVELGMAWAFTRYSWTTSATRRRRGGRTLVCMPSVTSRLGMASAARRGTEALNPEPLARLRCQLAAAHVRLPQEMTPCAC